MSVGSGWCRLPTLGWALPSSAGGWRAAVGRLVWLYSAAVDHTWITHLSAGAGVVMGVDRAAPLQHPEGEARGSACLHSYPYHPFALRAQAWPGRGSSVAATFEGGVDAW